jgi:hypothetical protein
MIIAFSGRKHSGKTTLSKIAEHNNFQKISFGDKLKELVVKIYDWPLEWLYDPEKKDEFLNQPVFWNKETAKRMSALIGNNCSLDETTKELTSIRETLQYIGTEILRKYDNDFHLNELVKKIIPGNNYVLDDVRFKNELNLLKSMNAVCIYIMRPYYFDDISNHISEVNLNRHDFEHVLLNTMSLKRFQRQFKMYLDRLLVTNRGNGGLTKESLFQLLQKHNFNALAAAKELSCSIDKIYWWAKKFMIHMPRNQYDHNINSFSSPNPENSYWAGLLSADGTIKKHKGNYILELPSTDESLTSGFKKFLKCNKPIFINKRIGRSDRHDLTICCPYIIDDLKHWNI